MSTHHALGPSRMKEWLRCPYREHLLNEGWGPREPRWNYRVMQWIGTAVHAGLARYFRGDEADTYAAADISLTEAWSQPSDGSWKFDTARRHVHGALGALLDTRYGDLDSEDVVSVDTPLVYGSPDLVYRDGGALVVVDWKVRLRDPREMSAWDHDWQMWQYVWETRQRFGQVPVRYEVAMYVLEPRGHVYVHEVPVVAERLETWEYAARTLWARREAQGTAPPPQIWAHCGDDSQFYRCDFIAHCHMGASLEAFYATEA